MSKLPEANLIHLPVVTVAEVASAIGMAALWTSTFKRMLYPMVYTYYRTGDADVIVAQGTYAIVFALACLVLFAARKKIVNNPRRFRWTAVLLGACGAAGVGLLQIASNPAHASPELYALSGSLVAAYVPVHIVFWLVVLKGLTKAQAKRSLVLSFGIFVVSYALLELAGAQTMFVSIICPLISATMALIIPLGQTDATHAGEQAPAKEATKAEQAAFSSVPEADIYAPPEANQAAGASAPEVCASDAGQPQAIASPFKAKDELFDPLIEQFAQDFGLSDREAELAAYTYRNYSARRIAGELFIAESTVYTHQKRIYRKCGVHSKGELIAQIDAWKHQVEAYF